MYTKIGLLILCLSISACGKQNVEASSTSDSSAAIQNEASLALDTGSTFKSQEEIDALVKVAIETGDCDSYQEAVVNRDLASNDHSLYLVSQYMAERYHCAIAYYYLGQGLAQIKLGEIRLPSPKGEVTEQLAIYYYLKAYELGYDNAKYVLQEFYGLDSDHLPKSSDYVVFPKLQEK